MKKKITNLFFGVLAYCSFLQNTVAQEEIKLIGFTYSGESISNIVKWNAGETEYSDTNAVDYVGVLGGSSVYNSNIGEYYSRILVNENEDYVSKFFKYNTQDNSISVNDVTNFFNGSAEVDMESGMLYSYVNDIDNNVYLNQFNPATQVSNNLGNYEFNEGTFFFPDASCYDSDQGIYYFIIQDEQGKKLVKTVVDSFAYTIIPIVDQNIIGNIGMEYSNEQNALHVIYPEFNNETGTSTMNVGFLNGETGQINNAINIAEITALQLFNRTYDQNTETLIFIGIDLNNEQRLYLYNTITNQIENRPLPQSLIYEIEADNFQYAQTRYNSLRIEENQVSNFVVSPNPVTTSFSVKYNGNTSNYEIFDVLGKSVQKGNIENGQQIEVNNLNKGVYFLNLKSETFNENKKIIIN